MKKIAIFASGTGSNAENIARFFSNGNRVKVDLLIYDRRDAPVAEKMRALDVETLFLPAEVWTGRPDEIVTILEQRGIDLVVLAGFLRHVPKPLTRAFTGRMINIHPSLLPAYSGKGMYGHKVHEAVVAAGETRSGASVHYVTDRLDEGEILMQEVVEVTPDDTPATLEAKVHETEYSLYPRAIVAALAKIDTADSGTATTTGAEEPDRPVAAPAPGEEWAEALGVSYDPAKLPPAYPGAVPPPVPGGGAPVPPDAATRQPAADSRAGSYSDVLRRNYGEEVPKMPPTCLVWAVVSTVCCCLPAGIVAIIFSSQVSSKYYAGDLEGATRASERAQIWIIVSFVLGVLANTLYLPIALLVN